MDEYAGIYEATLSPDGAKIAFTANSPDAGDWDIFVMDVEAPISRT
jgi:Tol biopolymer transport system component